MEPFLASLDKTKYSIPDPFPFEEARQLFKKPLVTPSADVTVACVRKA